MSRRQSLWLARAYYFFYFGAVGWYFPYLNLYFERAGLPGAAIGSLAAIGPAVLLAAGPVWGMIADRFHVHRWLLAVATLGPILPTLLVARYTAFAPLAALVALAAFFFQPIGPLIDSAVLDLINTTDHSYGTIRVWGSVGFTLMVSVAGYVIRAAGLRWMFYGYAGCMAWAGLLALPLPPRAIVWQSSFHASLRRLIGQQPLLLLFVSIFLVGAAFSAGLQFLPLRLAALGASPAEIGWANAIGALAEMPFLFFSGAMFRHLGVRGTLLMSYGVFAARWALVGLATSPGLVLATQALHGLTFGAMLVGSVAFVDQHTPPGLAATAQSLLVTVNFGLGAAAGALTGGWLYQNLGATGMFGVMSGLTAVGLVIFLTSTRRSSAA